MYIYILLLIILLILSAVFSASETAMFNIKPSLIHDEKLKTSLKDIPSNLITILTGNLIVNISASSIWTMIVTGIIDIYKLNPAFTLSLSSLLMVVMLLIFGEITPKLIAIRNSEKVYKVFLRPLKFFNFILKPLNYPLILLGGLFKKEVQPFPTDDELKTLITSAKEKNIIRSDEESILWNLLELDERTVNEVMTPRVEIIAFDYKKHIFEIIDTVKKTGKSRYPVYETDIDSIVGVIYITDIILARKKMLVKDIMRKPYFIPSTKNLYTLFQELRKGDTHIAIVVDEFGGTEGLCTLEDVLESVFGEIDDEFDKVEKPIKRLTRGKYIVDGDIDIKTLNRIFPWKFEEIEEERLSGFLLMVADRMLKENDIVLYKGISFKILKMDGNKIEKVKIEIKHD